MFAITTTQPTQGFTTLYFNTEASAYAAIDALNACPDRFAYMRGRVNETHCEGKFTKLAGLSYEASAMIRARRDFTDALPHRMVVEVRSLMTCQSEMTYSCRIAAGWKTADEMPLPEDLAKAQRAQECANG